MFHKLLLLALKPLVEHDGVAEEGYRLPGALIAALALNIVLRALLGGSLSGNKQNVKGGTIQGQNIWVYGYT